MYVASDDLGDLDAQEVGSMGSLVGIGEAFADCVAVGKAQHPRRSTASANSAAI